MHHLSWWVCHTEIAHMSSPAQPKYTTLVTVIGSLIFALLIVYAIRINFWYERDPIVLDIPKTTLADTALKLEKKVRKAAAAGDFYPADATELREAVTGYLAAAELPESEGVARIIIAPHAGYAYSGAVAAHSFKAIEGKGYTRAILLGSSHKEAFDHVAVDLSDVWEIPSGEVKVDKEFGERLIRESGAEEDAAAHEGEHMLEVMLPFLIETLGENVEIVPVLFGNDDTARALAVAGALVRLMDDETVIVVSSDLAHYPEYDVANESDRKVLDALVAGGGESFGVTMQNLQDEADFDTVSCSKNALLTGVVLAEAFGFTAQELAYANSGDVFEDMKDRVVGYPSVAFYGTTDDIAQAILGSIKELDAEAQQYALAIARQTIMAAFEQKRLQLGEDVPVSLLPSQGVFVSMEIGNALRGSIGIFESSEPLASTIQQMALAAAFGDERFEPLTSQELEQVTMIISVLSPLVKVSSAERVVIGEHGVRVVQGDKSGVFLPQVATEQGWDLETTMNEVCAQKAGLSKDCWMDSDTEIYVFTAQVITEPPQTGEVHGGMTPPPDPSMDMMRP